MRPSLGGHGAAQAAQERRLAGARAPDDGDELAGLDADRQGLERGGTTVTLGETFDGDAGGNGTEHGAEGSGPGLRLLYILVTLATRAG